MKILLATLLILGSPAVQAQSPRQVIDSGITWTDEFSPTTLTWVNADTDQDVAVMYTRMILDMKETPRFTIRANIDRTFTTQSVVFVVGNDVVRIEHKAPYALNGNNGTDYFAWTPPNREGMTNIYAIPYSGKNATGKAGPYAFVTPSIRFPRVYDFDGV